MKFFVDTAQTDEIRALNAYGLLDGVTTNPSLIAKAGRDFKDVVAEICAMIDGPVSAEVAATESAGMIAEGEHLSRIAENVVIKLPTTLDGLAACRHFAAKGIRTNLTLCFSANQALLVAKAGATYVSPFVGRLDDINLDGMALIRDIRTIYDRFSFPTQILAASLRTANHVTGAALAGADVATVPPAVILGLIRHPLTDSGLETFTKDWAATGQSIL